MPYGAGGGGQENGLGVAALVLGIIGLVLMCAYGSGIIFSVLAIVLGKMGMNKAAQGRANNAGMAKAGFIMGIVGTVIGVIVVLFFILVFAGALLSGETTTIN